MCLLRLRFQIIHLHSTLRLSTVGHLANEQASTVPQILFRGVMTPALLPVRPGLHSTDVGHLPFGLFIDVHEICVQKKSTPGRRWLVFLPTGPRTPSCLKESSTMVFQVVPALVVYISFSGRPSNRSVAGGTPKKKVKSDRNDDSDRREALLT